jgi:hypothetical protein
MAADVGRISGRGDAVRAAVAQAPSRAQGESVLLVELHRSVCAPLADADPDDLDAARRLLAARGGAPRESACRTGAGRDELQALLGAAPGLQRLTAAVRLRAAARAFAEGQTADGQRLLDGVPESLRGTTWTIVGAWGARLAHDPVTASRLLARLDRDTLERLRSSGNEDVARMVTRADAP